MSGIGLLIRVVFSLGIVLGLVWLAAHTVRSRGLGGLRSASRGPSRGPGPFDVLARTGLSRGCALAAVRFGDKVHLVAAPETATPVLLASVDADEWDAFAARDDTQDADAVPGLAPADPLEFLRTVTARRRR